MLSGSAGAATAVAVGCGVLTAGAVERQLAVAVRSADDADRGDQVLRHVSLLWS